MERLTFSRRRSTLRLAAASVGVLGCALAAWAFAGCRFAPAGGHSPTSTKGGPGSVTSEGDASSLSAGFDSFAIDSVADLQGGESKNLCYSPLSLQLALAMLGPGLGHSDLSKLSKSLGFSTHDLTSSSAISTFIDSSEGRGVTIANSLWSAPGWNLNGDYAAAALSGQQATAKRLTSFGVAGAEEINQWTAEHTKDRIKHLIDSLDPSVRLVLVNALTFDGKWAHRFDGSETKPETFTQVDGTKSPEATMHGTFSIGYGKGSGFEVGRFAYQGIDCAMDIVLPTAGQDPWKTLQDHSKELLGQGGIQLSDTRMIISLPKFTMSNRLTLTPLLKHLGLGSFLADLPDQRMVDTTERLNISDVVQSTWIETGEDGTKAAAATGIVIRATAIRIDPKETPRFTVDRPFAYIVRDLKTGAILFVGAVYHPKAADSK